MSVNALFISLDFQCNLQKGDGFIASKDISVFVPCNRKIFVRSKLGSHSKISYNNSFDKMAVKTLNVSCIGFFKCLFNLLRYEKKSTIHLGKNTTMYESKIKTVWFWHKLILSSGANSPVNFQPI